MSVDSNAKCIELGDGMDTSERQMFPISSSLCHCNHLADKAYPGVCNVLCKDGIVGSCYCKDPRRAGLLCNQTTCKMGRKIYCTSLIVSHPRQCTLQVNQERMADIPNCECRHGALKGDRCECDEGYTGALCEEGSGWAPTHRPPMPGPSWTTSKGPTGETSSSPLKRFIPMAVGFVAVSIFAVIIIIYCRRRRNRYAGGITIRTTAPGGQIATTTIPLVAEQPFGGGRRYGQYYEPPVLVPGQPVTTYHQPPAVATTYGFQPPRMAGMAVPSAPPAPSQTQPVAAGHGSREPFNPVPYEAPPPAYNEAIMGNT